MSLSGSTLELAGTLLTVSVLPGNIDGESSSQANGESNGQAAASVGTIGFGQSVARTAANIGGNGAGDPTGQEPEALEAEPPIIGERIPAWERLSTGLESAWERVRDAVLELEDLMPAETGRDHAESQPAAPAGQSRPGAASPAPARSSSKAVEESPGVPATDSAKVQGPGLSIAAIDAVLAGWETRQPSEELSDRPGPTENNERAGGERHELVRAIVVIGSTAVAAGSAWRWSGESTRFRRRRPDLLRRR